MPSMFEKSKDFLKNKKRPKSAESDSRDFLSEDEFENLDVFSSVETDENPEQTSAERDLSVESLVGILEESLSDLFSETDMRVTKEESGDLFEGFPSDFLEDQNSASHDDYQSGDSDGFLSEDDVYVSLEEEREGVSADFKKTEPAKESDNLSYADIKEIEEDTDVASEDEETEEKADVDLEIDDDLREDSADEPDIETEIEEEIDDEIEDDVGVDSIAGLEIEGDAVEDSTDVTDIETEIEEEIVAESEIEDGIDAVSTEISEDKAENGAGKPGSDFLAEDRLENEDRKRVSDFLEEIFRTPPTENALSDGAGETDETDGMDESVKNEPALIEEADEIGTDVLPSFDEMDEIDEGKSLQPDEAEETDEGEAPLRDEMDKTDDESLSPFEKMIKASEAMLSLADTTEETDEDEEYTLSLFDEPEGTDEDGPSLTDTTEETDEDEDYTLSLFDEPEETEDVRLSLFDEMEEIDMDMPSLFDDTGEIDEDDTLSLLGESDEADEDDALTLLVEPEETDEDGPSLADEMEEIDEDGPSLLDETTELDEAELFLFDEPEEDGEDSVLFDGTVDFAGQHFNFPVRVGANGEFLSRAFLTDEEKAEYDYLTGKTNEESAANLYRGVDMDTEEMKYSYDSTDSGEDNASDLLNHIEKEIDEESLSRYYEQIGIDREDFISKYLDNFEHSEEVEEPAAEFIEPSYEPAFDDRDEQAVKDDVELDDYFEHEIRPILSDSDEEAYRGNTEPAPPAFPFDEIREKNQGKRPEGKYLRKEGRARAPRRPSFLNSAWNALWMVKFICLGLIVGIFLVVFVIQRNDVVGSSMQSTLKDKDVVLVEMVSNIFRGYHRGDIVTLDASGMDITNDDSRLIKRIVGLPGETISIRDGLVYINDEQIQEPYLSSGIVTKAPTGDGTMTLTLGSDEYFCLGDNRPESYDSRNLGPFSKKRIKGHVLAQIFPWQDASILYNG